MIDLAFAIAFALSVLKLGEIMLRPHQRQLLQSKVESITLLLDYRTEDYANWLRVLRRLSRKHVMIISIALLVCSVFAINSGSDATVFAGLIGILFSVQFAGAAGLWDYAGAFFDWVEIDHLSVRSVARILGMFVAVVADLALNFLPTSESEGGEVTSLAAGIAGIALLLYFVTHPRRWLIWNALSSIAFLLTAAFFVWALLAVLARILVGLLWRTIEYSSGVWAAILFVVTGALGVLRIFVR